MIAVKNIKKGEDVMVFVLSKNGQPLMPTEDHRMVRLLLKTGKAKVVRVSPFTVKLLTGTHNYKQPVCLGVDAGSKHIGLSACTDKNVLYEAEMEPRNDVHKLLSKRLELRRSRRNRKTRYRAPRFDNRTHSKNKGWLAPSVEVKIHNHIQGIRFVCSILPITKVIVETAEFDLQRLKAIEEGRPLPAGTDYQKGEQYDKYNTRQYVLWRDGYKCRCCGKRPTEKEPIRLEVHHIESRLTGGDSPGNMATFCEICHVLYHQGKIQLKGIKRTKSTRDATFMGIMRKTLVGRLRKMLDIPVYETYGYITKGIREENHIEKSHVNDARCIARHPELRPTEPYLMIPVRAHNRKLHKETILKGGVRKAHQAPKYVQGYRLNDMVKAAGELCFIHGRRTKGGFDLRHLDGTVVNANYTVNKIRLIQRQTNLLIERRTNSSQG